MYVLARIYGHTTVAASGFDRGVYPPGRAVKRQARSGNLIKSTKPLWLWLRTENPLSVKQSSAGTHDGARPRWQRRQRPLYERHDRGGWTCARQTSLSPAPTASPPPRARHIMDLPVRPTSCTAAATVRPYNNWSNAFSLFLSLSPFFASSFSFILYHSFSLRCPLPTVGARTRSPDTVRTLPNVAITASTVVHSCRMSIISSVHWTLFFWFTIAPDRRLTDASQGRRTAIGGTTTRPLTTGWLQRAHRPRSHNCWPCPEQRQPKRQRVSSRRLSSNVIITSAYKLCYYPIRHNYCVNGLSNGRRNYGII